METMTSSTNLENNSDLQECARDPSEEFSIRDLCDDDAKEEPCFWCELENKCGKKIGDVTLAELTEYSKGKYVFDFCTELKSSKKVASYVPPASPQSPSSTLEALEPATQGEMAAPAEESQAAGAAGDATQAEAHDQTLGRAPCKHCFVLSGGRSVQLTSMARRAVVLHRPVPLSERNPLLTLISTLTDIFIAVTFTVTCWILFSKSRTLNV